MTIQRDDERETVSVDRVELASRAAAQPERTRTNDDHLREGEEGHVIDRIVNHERQPDGTVEFRVRWVGPDDDTWEPVTHLPYSHVARYCRRAKIPVPPNINRARAGFLELVPAGRMADVQSNGIPDGIRQRATRGGK